MGRRGVFEKRRTKERKIGCIPSRLGKLGTDIFILVLVGGEAMIFILVKSEKSVSRSTLLKKTNLVLSRHYKVRQIQLRDIVDP
jgi:hypothetical protein